MGIYWNRHTLTETINKIYPIFKSEYNEQQRNQLIEDTVFYIMNRTSDEIDEEYARHNIRNVLYVEYYYNKVDILYRGIDPIFLHKTIIEICSCKDHPELNGKKGLINSIEQNGLIYGDWGNEPININSDLLEIWNL